MRGRTFTGDYDMTLMVRGRGGMPKKGCRKTVPKDEKVFTLRTRVEYLTRTATAEAMNIVRSVTARESFIKDTIANMTSVADVEALRGALQEVRRNEGIPEAIAPYLIQQINQMKREIAERNETIRQVEATIEHAYAKEFYTDGGYSMSALYDMVSERLDTLRREQQINDAIRSAASVSAPMLEG